MKREREVSFVDQAFLGQKDSGLHAEVFFLETETSKVVAHTYIEAPGRGDEALSLVMGEIQRKADELQKPIVHEGQPSNKGAVRLFRRTPGYRRKRSLRGPVYVRTFNPAII
ncbi:hypothetical protein A3G67_01375 [Candidatus Roizmanbacteria bacterium RIFCSPLOWO2_12_FULL_40_12]|nr:MAG: hypothetical protein A2W49_00905 [Candidatus Roizmanbacteria bacterium RIFCSPHIGHO2_12_41_18]OGK59676.1 MAG: hypothetical protein A3H84_00295 [Candidatus Roizmanbacteria bacterium RIFCSPLOWO2_02_FULL_40_13]OGK61596.1 MAG: hypothetical protein A3G67_01375 [Candidatus Roizmanbacteria bacterium RIFCSPLOWO2_12_FULL_40_12]